MTRSIPPPAAASVVSSGGGGARSADGGSRDVLAELLRGEWIDPDTGVLGPGRTRTHCDYVTTVPGTDRPLVGYRVPLWAEVKRLALDAAAAFPWARAIGWDIAVAERGAVLIEGNARWSPSLVQLPAPHGLMDGELEALYRERCGGDAT